MITDGPEPRHRCDQAGCKSEDCWYVGLDRMVPWNPDWRGDGAADMIPFRCLKHFREVLTPEEMAELELLLTLEALP